MAVVRTAGTKDAVACSLRKVRLQIGKSMKIETSFYFTPKYTVLQEARSKADPSGLCWHTLTTLNLSTEKRQFNMIRNGSSLIFIVSVVNKC